MPCNKKDRPSWARQRAQRLRTFEHLQVNNLVLAKNAEIDRFAGGLVELLKNWIADLDQPAIVEAGDQPSRLTGLAITTGAGAFDVAQVAENIEDPVRGGLTLANSSGEFA